MRDEDGGPLKLQLPTVRVLAPDCWRIFLAARGKANLGRMIFVDVDPTDDMAVVDCGEAMSSRDPDRAAFEADGVGPGCLFELEGRVMMARVGIRLRWPFYEAAMGFASSRDGGRTFHREPNLKPFSGLPGFSFAVSPDIQRVGDTWHMWYSQGLGWREEVRPFPEPTYAIAHATSVNGIDWSGTATIVLQFKSDDETGITRPCVRPRPDAGKGWEMWYCYRRNYDDAAPAARRYKIGYATSDDLQTWTRRDEDHLFVNPPRPGDWDHEMQCYATVVTEPGRSVMIYCGNGYGVGGIGFAERIGA